MTQLSPDRLTGRIDRIAERLRTLPGSRLRAGSPSAAPAVAAHRLASVLAEAAQGIEERSLPHPPDFRELPWVDLFSVGDQVAVTGHDLVAACTALLAHPGDENTGSTAVWSRSGRRDVEEVLADVADTLRTLERLL